MLNSKITKQEKIEMANTIVNQLTRSHNGQAMLKLYVSAYNFLLIDNGISFKFKGSKAFNYVSITLNGKDLYDVSFKKIRKLEIVDENTINDLCFEDLMDCFERETQLYLLAF